MSQALERIGFDVDWSNPLAGALDSVIRGAIKELGLDEYLEKVSGDNEKLLETAREWRAAARGMQGVVDDLQAERRALQRTWTGEASEAFGGTMSEFEKALQGEAEDMITVAELLEMAAESCAEAEETMVVLITEVVEALLVAAATAAIVAILTAGVGAAIGPLIGAAGAAHRAMKAVRITAKLADKLKDLADRMRALQKLRRARIKAKALWRNKNARKKLNKNLKRIGNKVVGAKAAGAAIGAAPLANSVIEHHTGVDVGEYVSEKTANIRETVAEAGNKAERELHDATGLKEVRIGDKRWDVEHQTPVGAEAPKEKPPTEQQKQYAGRPDSERFTDRLADGAARSKPVREVFG
ncbi:WXG100 family type VII secretion target [Streptomyces lydicus]|uniref:WXG100 family type VII secretion target n=1 Tax=Streptomyces lydicus TaxID=47763 RepID=UPI001013C140|nr:WXG100 family type VII secretion target [Streptomyces lydicus]MCZ1006543.1 WXG100 family type VII secretion target [Streptomyces lydicus]